jgi:pimeloyl-ACP methyl ester carboxylesterase
LDLKKNLIHIGDFPFDDEKGLQSDGRTKSKWEGKTLFIKGAKSKYLNRKNMPICDAYFPNAKHVTLETGHWVQAEKPDDFIQEVTKFVQ